MHTGRRQTGNAPPQRAQLKLRGLFAKGETDDRTLWKSLYLHEQPQGGPDAPLAIGPREHHFFPSEDVDLLRPGALIGPDAMAEDRIHSELFQLGQDAKLKRISGALEGVLDLPRRRGAVRLVASRSLSTSSSGRRDPTF